ncbi:unnamed protein product [Somion occarium]|uniref:UBC core domain-containing protein n=1 Tax=Somion occarium TaxID=3059160 RepID=A0ABP1CLG8_9APHY
MNSDNQRNAAKLYQEDIVRLKSNPKVYGVVMVRGILYLRITPQLTFSQRCWHDPEDIPFPEDVMVDPLLRPLKHGEVGVSFYPGGKREILQESELQLVDRMYQPGDLLKKSIDNPRAGIVTSIDVKGRLEHTISGEEIPGWKGTDDVECSFEVDMGDYVVYNDWVGQIVEIFDEAVVELSSEQLVRLPELSARLAVGQRGNNIIPHSVSGVQNLFGFLLGNGRTNAQDTVIAVKRTVLAIAWLAINQSLTSAEAATRNRPQRFWYGSDLSKLTLVRRRAEQAMRVGDRVLLKNPNQSPATVHGREGDPAGSVTVRDLVVTETHTMVNVLWQDGTRDLLDCKETIPYVNPDEYDCWPGDHVIWKSEDGQRTAVVQSVNAVERTAQVRFDDTGATELVSVLELDPHGVSDWSAVAPHEEMGLHRGDCVFIHPEGSSNGVEKPMVPKIGELEGWVREMTMDPNGMVIGWRNEMIGLGNAIAEHRGRDPSVEEGKIRRPQKGHPSLHWFGEVTDLRLDGTVEVMFPDGISVNLPLERLTRLYDGLEQLQEMWGDDGSDSQDDESEHVHGDHIQFWAMDEEEDPSEVPALSPPAPCDTTDPETMRAQMEFFERLKTDTMNPSGDVEDSPDALPSDDVQAERSSNGELPWKRFDILPSAPPDHAFHASTPAQTSRTFLARLSKEYKILASSLPDTILVRAYEDRTDLLRSLIIGPENTPYEDAPFVIDWQLDSNFPHSPPIAHFLSWTNGNGRVNPNLYEEGKVCLSILGTWTGDKSESWSASRSSLLQAFVSIQGLVLVKEPWYCEPAYEKLRGTEEGAVNSRLYSEKAFVLSRNFVRRALEIPLGGLEGEIDWFYYKRGLLRKVVTDARSLIEKSKTDTSEADGDRAIPRLTGGGIIALERTLTKLQTLLDAHRSS